MSDNAMQLQFERAMERLDQTKGKLDALAKYDTDIINELKADKAKLQAMCDRLADIAGRDLLLLMEARRLLNLAVVAFYGKELSPDEEFRWATDVGSLLSSLSDMID